MPLGLFVSTALLKYERAVDPNGVLNTGVLIDP
jgi:FAD/FMN-containing dehydrogenase